MTIVKDERLCLKQKVSVSGNVISGILCNDRSYLSTSNGVCVGLHSACALHKLSLSVGKGCQAGITKEKGNALHKESILNVCDFLREKMQPNLHYSLVSNTS